MGTVPAMRQHFNKDFETIQLSHGCPAIHLHERLDHMEDMKKRKMANLQKYR